MHLDGGVLCMDFVNTVHDRVAVPLPDYLCSVSDVLDWALRLRLISRSEKLFLSGKATRNPRQAADFFKAALYFRELLYGIFLSIVRKQQVSPAALKSFNEISKKYLYALSIKQQKHRFIEAWQWEKGGFDKIIAPVAKSAYELLIKNDPARVKECPACGWLFLDTTKNGRRRWCNMQVCGSNDKSLRYYHRKKRSLKK